VLQTFDVVFFETIGPHVNNNNVANRKGEYILVKSV